MSDKKSAKILIVSDTHGSNSLYLALVKKYAPLDMVIHCGDTDGTDQTILMSPECPVYLVQGNNDFFSEAPKEQEFLIGRYRVLLTHGHHYYISMGNEILKQEARARHCNIVMYGHTHRPVIDLSSDVIAINPGSLTYPRQENRKPSYILMTLDDEGEAHFELNYLP
ncbi:MAG: metallophosphoesterase [Lachnospiraceae bacterium]|nr:metallophosphoesterase [Lachnospiraceae bacterium]